MHKTHMCPEISHTHKSINYKKYHHDASYITINNITVLHNTTENKKITLSWKLQHRDGQLVSKSPLGTHHIC
jgi:hypothetical protein